MYQRVAHGPVTENVKGMVDAVPREVLAIAPIIALTLAVGVFPKPVFDVVNPAIERTLEFVDIEPVAPEVVVDEDQGSVLEGEVTE
jgi:NADH-quinone oxidoreductase subunit M